MFTNTYNYRRCGNSLLSTNKPTRLTVPAHLGLDVQDIIRELLAFHVQEQHKPPQPVEAEPLAHSDENSLHRDKGALIENTKVEDIFRLKENSFYVHQYL